MGAGTNGIRGEGIVDMSRNIRDDAVRTDGTTQPVGLAVCKRTGRNGIVSVRVGVTHQHLVRFQLSGINLRQHMGFYHLEGERFGISNAPVIPA